ncbi:MAG: hypothetical protein ACRECX_00660 [Methyloceanibacter sp.]|uniref:hypothetical protein n=1 Tax=Methyloceanibacter sp. TaxID=1965321 RepID=UPI003D6CB042
MPTYGHLVAEAKRRLDLCGPTEGFDTGIPEAERMLSDLENFPHHYVLACLMDRQLGAKQAWVIPYRVGLVVGGFDFSHYNSLSLQRTQTIFAKERLHRFRKNIMPTIFFRGVQRIATSYKGVASSIWSENPRCALVIRRFLEFDGVGPKIATMATNILVRQLKVPMRDKSAIDISADRQVMKYFQSIGLLREDAKKEELIYLAREISPEYPGLLDLLAWEQGRLLKRKRT